MSDVSSLETCLRTVHTRLALLADAIGGADVERMEVVGRDLADVVARLRTCATGDVSSGDEVALAAADVRWQLERCRRLGWPFRRTLDVAMPAYEPDGRSRHVAIRPPTIEVLG